MTSEGKCFFCGKTFAKSVINRHLATHLKEKTNLKEKTKPEKPGKPGKSFFVKVEMPNRQGKSLYFLNLWIDGEAKMDDLDTFLRNIWLECCDHMSAFTNPKIARQRRHISPATFENIEQYLAAMNKLDDEVEISMNKKVKTVLSKGLELVYEYDFGSTTKLTVTVVDEYPLKAEKKIVLLSRNEPLKIMCDTCGKSPATQLCTACMYDGESKFCDKCARKHAKKCGDFADYASTPVVNSPRMGVCGYRGGRIDVERDGAYVLKE